ncbi:MAG: hypothetical protein F4X66_10180 [Chloroflexi bacterium]|nr:hypothetical protein [Chloroflexota bacterium]
MRIYYVMETRGRRCHVLSALGVDVRAWNRLHRRVREWHRRLKQRHGIPANEERRLSDLLTATSPADPSCGCDCHTQSVPPHGTEMVAQGLRVVEDFAVETGGVGIINVCLDMDKTPAHRRVALDRLFNRVNATADREGGYALLIFGQEPDDIVVRTYERLRSHNPVPVRVGACGDGWHTRNLPIDRIIGGPVFRDPGADCLLQVAGIVAHALLWREEPSASGMDAGENVGAFTVLDHALNLRASRHDSRGIVRR